MSTQAEDSPSQLEVDKQATLALEIRRQQTLQGITSLRTRVLDWIERRRQADRDAKGTYIGRHKTQLESIESVLGGAAKALVDEVGEIKTTLSTGTFYRRCRRVDEAAAWLQRVWEFYRERFDQRDDLPKATPAKIGAGPATPAYPGPTVRAADEVVWSTYHQVMKAAEALGRDHGPAPLAFVAAEYSPAAIDSQRPLAQHLRLYLEFPTFDARLKAIVDKLAVPLLVLPPWSVNAPWWLIFVAHEVGHLLTKQLKLFSHFSETIDRAAKKGSGLLKGIDSIWKPWHDEIAADAWSLVLVGPAAAEALAEVEMGPPETLRTEPPGKRYPPPVIRLALMACLANKLGFEAPSLPTEFALEPHKHDPLIKQLAGQIDQIADAMLEPLPDGLGNLGSLAGVSPPDGTQEIVKRIDWWSNNLRARPKDDARSLEAARYVTAATLREWRRLATETKDVATHEEASANLAKAALDVLGAAGPDGERGDEQPDGTAPELAKTLKDLLLSLSDEQAPDVAAPSGATTS